MREWAEQPGEFLRGAAFGNRAQDGRAVKTEVRQVLFRQNNGQQTPPVLEGKRQRGFPRPQKSPGGRFRRPVFPESPFAGGHGKQKGRLFRKVAVGRAIKKLLAGKFGHISQPPQHAVKGGPVDHAPPPGRKGMASLRLPA